jgi:hypothetical protein
MTILYDVPAKMSRNQIVSLYLEKYLYNVVLEQSPVYESEIYVQMM